MTQHVNSVILIGTALQTWWYGSDRGVRLQIRRPAFFPVRCDGPSDLVNVILPEGGRWNTGRAAAAAGRRRQIWKG